MVEGLGDITRWDDCLLCKKAGQLSQVPHLVSLMRNHAVQPTS